MNEKNKGLRLSLRTWSVSDHTEDNKPEWNMESQRSEKGQAMQVMQARGRVGFQMPGVTSIIRSY